MQADYLVRDYVIHWGIKNRVVACSQPLLTISECHPHFSLCPTVMSCNALSLLHLESRAAGCTSKIFSGSKGRIANNRHSRKYSPYVIHLVRLSDERLGRINEVIAHSWAASTYDKYSSAVMDFLAFCKSEGIKLSEALPSSEDLLCFYIASMAGRLAGGTAGNKISGLKSWHIENDWLWAGSLRLKHTIRGTENLRPPKSKKPERPPLSVKMLKAVRDNLDLTRPLDACVWAIATTSF